MHDGNTFAENCQLVGRRPTGLGIGLSWHLRLNSGCSPALKRQVEALLNKTRVKLLLEKIFQGREAAGRQPGHNRARRTSGGFSISGTARTRSEERRVGKECRSRWSADN